MRPVRYSIAMSLDGYIAGPQGVYDWIPDEPETVERLRRAPGKDIWLYGGGEPFRSLLAQDPVDLIEVGLVPVLLGRGLPFLPPLDR